MGLRLIKMEILLFRRCRCTNRRNAIIPFTRPSIKQLRTGLLADEPNAVARGTGLVRRGHTHRFQFFEFGNRYRNEDWCCPALERVFYFHAVRDGKTEKKWRRSDGSRLALQHSSYRTRAGPDDRHTRTWFLLFTFTNYFIAGHHTQSYYRYFLPRSCLWFLVHVGIHLPPLLN